MEEEVTGKEVKLGGGGVGAGEVDFKTKAGTAWSHSYLNQKPWHPLSYPNQRRKWIAEQVTANHSRRQEEVAREFAQEQEFFRQTALFNKKDKDKVEMMKAVSFMYVRPPGYNSESAKAAEIADENKSNATPQDPTAASSSQPDTGVDDNQPIKDRKVRPKDVFGRALPTEQEFEVLKNAPRLDTGVAARSKPFAVEIRNVKCVRCGTFGHQSGDRECPLKDVIMPNDESRLKRDDPLNAILAQTDTNEPLKWELKQKPGMSPPRGGFRLDDPNQQIVAEHDEIFDEYGGFLTGGDIPALLSNFSPEKPKKERRRHQCSKSKSKQKQHSSSDSESESEPNKSKRSKRKHEKHYSSDSDEAERSRRRSKGKHKSRNLSESSPSSSEDDGFRQAGRYDGRHYSSRRSKKRESEHLEKDTGRSKSTEARSNKTKDEKHVTAHSDRSEPDSDCLTVYEYGGFLTGGDIPALLSNFSREKPKKERRKHQCSKSKSKQKQHSSSDSESESEPNKSKRSKRKHKKHYSSDSDEAERSRRRSKGKHKSRNLSESSPSSSEDDGFRQAGRYDGRHYSSRTSKKRVSEHLEKDTGRSKSTEARSNKTKDEKHITAHSDRSEPDSDCRRHHRHCRHHHHHYHHSRHR